MTGRWIVAALAVVAGMSGCSGKGQPVTKVAVCQYVHHPALDEARRGFMEEMNRLGYAEGTKATFDYFNAEGDMNLAGEVADRIARGKYDLVFSLATPMTQLLKKKMETAGTPIVFGAITDPLSAGLVASLEKPAGKLTGTSDVWPYYEQLALLKKVLPKVKKLGVVFNPAEANTQYAMSQTRNAASKLEIDLIEAPVSSLTEVSVAAETIASRSEAFYVPADNTAMAAASTIVKVAQRHRLPVLAGDPGTFDQGCLIGLGVSYYNLGVQSARMADRILRKSELPGNIPVASSQEGQVMVNVTVAKELGITIPQEILNKAARVKGAGE